MFILSTFWRINEPNTFLTFSSEPFLSSVSLILATSFNNIHKIGADSLQKLDKSHSTEKQMARGRTSLPSVLSAKKCPKIAEDEPTEVRQFMAKRSSFSAKLERFRLEFFPIISNFTYFSNNLRKKS